VTVEAPISEHRLRLEIVFQGIDEGQAQAVAAKMIDRAHEIANLPEYECDVDVSVEQTSAESHIDPGEQPARGHSVAR
jgi:hypothetical protein